MTARGALNVVLEGRGPLTLRDTDYITTGGEGSIYRANATIVKIYTDTGKMVRDGMPEKVRLIADQLKHDNIVAPQGVVTDKAANPIGFYMPFVDGEPMSRVFVSDFRSRTGFDDKNAVGLVTGMHDVVAAAHASKALMVDANELNWLVHAPKKKTPVPKVIDVNSWAIGRWPATVIMPSIRDWGAKVFDEKTNWFAFGVVSFQVFTGIHPFKGKVDGFKPGELIRRMKEGVSVFDARARLPHAVRDFGCIPGPLLDWYRATFQEGERTKAPSPLDTSKPAKAAQVLRAVVTGAGNLTFEKLFGRPDDPVIQIWPCGAARLASGEVVDLGTGRTIGAVASVDAEILKFRDGWLIADWVDGLPSFSYVDGPGTAQVAFSLSVKRFFRSGDRLFTVIERELIELQLRVLGKPVVTVGRRWSMMTNSTRWFDGVAVQDVLGAAFVFLPINGNGAVHVRVKELDGLNIVSAKGDGRFAAFVALDRSGDYRKIELTFDKTHSSYNLWTGGTDSPDLNMAILPTGVAATIATDGELTIFVPTNGNVTKVQDRGITTAMGLTAWGDRIVYIQDGNVWRVRIEAMTYLVTDTETTGLEKTDEVVELAAIDIDPVLPTVIIANQLVRPSKPIPPEATAIHHITNEMVRNAPVWADVWPRYFRESALKGIKAIVGHKIEFDAQWITEEMRFGIPMICTWKCALRRWPEAKSHSNQALRYFLGIILGDEAVPPHRGLPDTFVSGAIFLELLKDCPLDQLIAWSAEPAVYPKIPFGKHQGMEWDEAPPDYLDWMIGPKNDLEADLKWNARRELARRRQAELDAVIAKRDAYAADAITLIEQAITVEDLRCWFAWEANARSGLGIYPDTPQYARIVEACTAKSNSLPLAIPRPAPETPHAQA